MQWTSYFSVESDRLDPKRLILALGNEDHEFAVRLNRLAIYDPKTREMINAWAIGIYTCPRANIAHRTIEEFLDHLEKEFPMERSLFPRPKIRQW